MPELNEVLEEKTGSQTTTKVVEVTTIEKTETDNPQPTIPVPEKKPATTATKKPVEKKSTTDKKAVDAKPEATTTEKKPESTATAAATPKKPVKKAAAKTEATDENDGETEKPLRRPPMEQLTKDFEKYVLSLEVGGHPIKSLGYKLGKVIYGIPNEESKDFRVIAFKARKKSKSVAGKSRCIFYFGITKDQSSITKKFPGTSTTEFGKCSVQVKKPIVLELDKTTYNEHFGQDVEKVMTVLKGLADLTIEHKNEEWKVFQEKVEAKKKATTEKDNTKKSPKVQKKATVGEE